MFVCDIVFFIFVDCSMFDFIGLLLVFDVVNCVSGCVFYWIMLYFELGGLICSLVGVMIQIECIGCVSFDILVVVGGGVLCEGLVFEVLCCYILCVVNCLCCIVGVCIGVFVLVVVGLFDGKCVIMYWCMVVKLQQMYLQVKVDSDCIYFCDGKVWILVGIFVGIDLVLVLIEEDYGVELVKLVVCELVVYYCCLGGQL